MIEENLLEEDGIKEKIVVYQLFMRLFGNKNTNNKIYGTLEENGTGKFNDIDDTALQALKQFGVTHVWFTGAIEHASMNDFSEYGIHADHASVVKGRAGSPYAIKDYYDVNPDLAESIPDRMKEYEALIERTHNNGLKVVMDFVPNHVARHYESDAKPEDVEDLGTSDDTSKFFDINNNFYYMVDETFVVPSDYNPLGPEIDAPTESLAYIEYPAKATGDNVFNANPSKDNWFETVKLNYGVDHGNNMAKHFDPIPKTWGMMKDILEYWTEKGVDAFRCDFVQFTPVEFWEWAIPQLKDKNPELIFIAEIYIPEEYGNYINRGKFDFLYDKVQLYDTIRHLMSGTGSTDNLPHIWKSLKGMNKNMIRFLENHDEQRIASPFFSGKPEPGIPGMVVSATLYTGPSMYYFGQEVGEPGAGASGFGGDDGRTTMFDYWGVPEHQKWMNNGKFDGGALSKEQKELRGKYQQLNSLCNIREALKTGKLFDIHQHNRYFNSDNGYTDKTYAYVRFNEFETLLILVNFNNEKPGPCTINLSPEMLELVGLESEGNYTLSDLMDPKRTFTMKDGTAVIEMEAWDAFIFDLK